MKRTLKRLILLYPKTWRNRYKNEFEALLDEVPPIWRTLFDVFGGAMKMQLRTSTPWKIVAVFGALGIVAAAGYSWTIPDRYISQAILKIEPGITSEGLQALTQAILSRRSLVWTINEEGLYERERTQMPLEELVEQMKSRDISIGQVAPGAISVSVAAADPARAQGATRSLAAKFIDAKAGSLIDPANLPAHPESRRRWPMIAAGMAAGVFAGVLFALFNGLKVWKLAAGLGVAGTVLGATALFVVPERYRSVAVVRYQGTDAGHIEQLFREVTSDAGLYTMVVDFGLYPNDPQAKSKLSENLRLSPVQNAKALTISFEYSDRLIAQKVVSDVLSRLIEEGFRTRVGGTLELLDPPTLPMTPRVPDRPLVVGAGFFLGLLCAVMVGIRRYYGRPLQRVAAG